MLNDDVQIDEQRELPAQLGAKRFQDLLVPISGEKDSWPALHQALKIARREGARLHGLHIVPSLAELTSRTTQAIQIEFDRRCHIAGIPGGLMIEAGEVGRTICQHAPWVDLVIIAAARPPKSRPLARVHSGLSGLLRSCPKPVLVVLGPTSEWRRVLLAYDGSPRAQEALSMARYLCASRRWQVSLAVVTMLVGKQVTSESLSFAREYLNMCASQPTFITAKGSVAEAILTAAGEHKSDLIIMGGYGFSPLLEIFFGSTVNQVLRTFRMPVLICP